MPFLHNNEIDSLNVLFSSSSHISRRRFRIALWSFLRSAHSRIGFGAFIKYRFATPLSPRAFKTPIARSSTCIVSSALHQNLYGPLLGGGRSEVGNRPRKWYTSPRDWLSREGGS